MLCIRLSMGTGQSADARCSFPLQREKDVRMFEDDQHVLPESFGARFKAPISVPSAFKTDIISAVRGLGEEQSSTKASPPSSKQSIHSRTNQLGVFISLTTKQIRVSRGERSHGGRALIAPVS